MSVLIVTESLFGNTFTIANAIGSTVAASVGPDQVTVVSPGEAPLDLPTSVDLVVVGAPTHAFSMPRLQSRQQAIERGAPSAEGIGVREWIEQVSVRPDLRVLTFDTSIRMRFSPGCAAKAAFKALKRRGFSHAERGPSFYVTATAGPLADGEERRAKDWALGLMETVPR